MGSVVSEITMGKLSPTQPLLSASPLSRATYACPNHRVSASHSTISHLSMKVHICMRKSGVGNFEWGISVEKRNDQVENF